MTRQVNTEWHGDMSMQEYEEGRQHPSSNNWDIANYSILGVMIRPNTYQVLYFVANACLVIGCLSVGKELFLSKPTATTA
ncbi:hypothetical protein I2I05_08480 [Hymenobacter sp. BT683]|uniref:Uncharacterized protein n=1 Tax=Hymenobacter jeongseonensis TaxID=2791027 RepID=A0ABS0IGX9_9BACT|nr:hypothetical protein [Hymenobacter jeongseonensis]MBF9237432.1 hypothetical protein [Hymenobacter jeongseonensis]